MEKAIKHKLENLAPSCLEQLLTGKKDFQFNSTHNNLAELLNLVKKTRLNLRPSSIFVS